MLAQSILFLTKLNDHYCEVAASFLRMNFETVQVVYTQRDKPIPPELFQWRGDWLISYLCRNVVPEWLLEKPTKGAINFHPAPPEYPGAGSLNVALYDGINEFGVTCHYMDKTVDTGRIISVRRFRVYENDTVLSLTQRCYIYQIEMFFDIAERIMAGMKLTTSGSQWTSKPYRLADFHALRQIRFGMSDDEIKRRIRATYYDDEHDKPYIEVTGCRFVYESEAK